MKSRQLPSGGYVSQADGRGNGSKPGQVREEITVVFRSAEIHPDEFEKDILHLFADPVTDALPALRDVCTRREENGLITYSFPTSNPLMPGEDPATAQRELHRAKGARIEMIAKKYAGAYFDNSNTAQYKM